MKIAIIGAGVCGLYLAKNLAERGNEVAVFEKKKTIGKACCSGLFSQRLFDFVPEARALATNTINGCVINFPKKTIKLRFKQPFFTLDHAQLDLLVAALATGAGAQIRVDKNIDFKKLNSLSQEYDRIIGADGALSIVRNYVCGGPTPAKLRGLNPRKNFGINFWLGIQGFEKKQDDGDFVQTWATQNGFLWKIPRGNDIEWGIMEKPDLAPKLFHELFQQGSNPCSVNLKGLSPCKFMPPKIENIKSAIIPQGLFIPENGKITLCGDASGLTKPWSGGGVVWNLTQANILLQNFPNFLQYKKRTQCFFNLRIFLGKTAKTGAYAAGFNFPWIIPTNISLDSDFLINFLKK
jgi:flavin-dependent dehydrogenase